MSLRLTVTIVFPPVRDLSPEARAIVRAAKRRTAAEMRRAMNGVRTRVRAEAPRRTGALARSVRVRRRRADVRGGITYELTLGKFYGRFTNSQGRYHGWWTGVIGEPEQDFRDTYRSAARDVGRAYLLSLRDQFASDFRASLSRIGKVVVRSISTRGPTVSILGSYRL